MDIVILKLSSGEECIAKKVDQNKYKSMRTFSVIQDHTGNIKAGLIPWLMSNPDAEVVINHDHIVVETKAPLDVEKSYLQNISGISLVNQ